MFYDEDHYKGKYSYVEAVSGCFFMIKSEALKRVNYFDENVFLYYEENILGEKLRNSSYTLVIIDVYNLRNLLFMCKSKDIL